MTSGTQGDRPNTSTVSDDEIARFSAMADEWWDPEGSFRPLHQLNPVRAAYIRDRLARHFERDPDVEEPLLGLSVLDIGCGGGLISDALARMGAAVTGIDASETAIAVAQLHAAREGLDIRFRCAAPETMLAEGVTYDAVMTLEVVEHVADVDAFFDAVVGLLKPGGALVLSTLNRTIASLLLAKIGAEYVLRWLPAGTHDWRKFRRPSELASVLRRHGAEMKDARGLSFGLADRRWSLSHDLAVNYIAYAVVPAVVRRAQ